MAKASDVRSESGERVDSFGGNFNLLDLHFSREFETTGNRGDKI